MRTVETRREALTNCAKHAHAKSIAVALNCVEHPAILTIKDDGIGFNTAAPAGIDNGGGFGLLNMREMAEFGGGRFSIESRHGQGTRIRVEA